MIQTIVWYTALVVAAYYGGGIFGYLVFADRP